MVSAASPGLRPDLYRPAVITINYRDPRPIYEQIQTELRRLMLTGVLPPGSRLPSVRELAGQLAINPNTIQRAYSQLETEGYVYTVSGRGTFVCEVREQNRQRRAEVTARVQPVFCQFIILKRILHNFKILFITARKLYVLFITVHKIPSFLFFS